MSTIGHREHETQRRVIRLFTEELGYEYLGNWKHREGNSNIEEELLLRWLAARGTPAHLATRAIHELKSAAASQAQKLYEVNKRVYGLLRYGVAIKPEAGAVTETVHFIDWKNPAANHFAIAEEVTVTGKNTKRPDLVLYVNGIALGIIELKRSIVSVAEGIRQNLDSQSPEFISPFFSTMQLVMAGNDTQGLRYGTVGTTEKYYLTWKEEGQHPLLLDKHLSQLCRKERLLELAHDFTVFDRGTKKLCRHNQYFGVKAAQEKLRRREGGIVWHTQGSGKSLIMVWLTKWILENIPGSRVLIITDREELDAQIEKVFFGVEENVYRTSSGKDLLNRLNEAAPALLCSLIHKFGRRTNGQDEENIDVEGYIQEIKNSLPAGFSPKGDVYVFVDECHRTQSGKLHTAMKSIMPDAVFVGFTGTPLLKADRQTSMEVFGPYIHTYKFNEAVEDEVVLDLLYEARDVDQYISSPERIDQWFDAKTKGLNDYQKAELKKRWGTLQKVLSSKARLGQIVNDIVIDMATKPRLMNGRGNALLVSSSIYQACRYYELFQQTDLKGKCAIITSYNGSADSIKGEAVAGNELTERLQQYDIYKAMLNGKDPARFEEGVKKMFIEQPAQMKLLIVVDKLLTGFDAPSATYLYIDKKMQDHSLFQAICRVNRLDGEDKQYGYIIDYKDLFRSVERAITDYTTEAFDGYAREDVEGLLKDRLKTSRARLEGALEGLYALCEPVLPPREEMDFIRYFCGDTENADSLKEHEPKRIALYMLVTTLMRSYAALANELEEAGYAAEETTELKAKVEWYGQLKDTIKIASGEYIDLKPYEADMRYLIDAYINAEESMVISAFEDLTLIQLIVDKGIDAARDSLPPSIRKNDAMAETIANNLRRLIIDESPANPVYFERMSSLLNELIRARKENAIDYATYLKKIAELCRQVTQPDTSAYPSSLNTPGKRALFDVLEDERLTIALHDAIQKIKNDEWRGNTIKERIVKNTVLEHVDAVLIDKAFSIILNQPEY